MDWLDGTLPAARAAHLERCPDCRARWEELRATFELASSVEVPEPSPLFWDRLSARVREAIDTEGERAHLIGAIAWWRRPAVALAAAVVAFLAAGGALWRKAVTPEPPGGASGARAVSAVAGAARTGGAEVGAEADESEIDWAVVLAVAGESDEEINDLDVLVDETILEEAVLELLSPAEQQALAHLIEAELKNAL